MTVVTPIDSTTAAHLSYPCICVVSARTGGAMIGTRKPR